MNERHRLETRQGVRSFPLRSPSLSPQSRLSSRPCDFESQPKQQCQSPRCRICWAELDESDDFVAPCDCKGSMEFVHVDCLARWSQHRKRRFRSQCDVCKRQLSYPGMKGCALAHGGLRVRRIWANQLATTTIRLFQLYIVSITVMGGMETAANSVVASILAYKEQRQGMNVTRQAASHTHHAGGSHVKNIIKVLTGIYIIRTVLFRRVDLPHLSKARAFASSAWRLSRGLASAVCDRLVF